MDKQRINPAIIVPGDSTRYLKRLPRLHKKFDENDLQDLLARYPDLLPVHAVRDDIGALLCVGREVAVSCGVIDNLYLSTSGYPVIVETKLWRNPQARREVLSQTLDYIKDVVRKDYEWFEKQWALYRSARSDERSSLIDALNALSNDEIDETFIVDRVNRALGQGDVIAMIVGDGIETRLQELVTHLCRDSCHLRYSLALVELTCYEIGHDNKEEILVVPRIVQDIEPVQRAYVRVEVPESFREWITVTPVVANATEEAKHSRANLNEEDFLLAVRQTVGRECADAMHEFYGELVKEYSLELDFKAAAIMVKVPHPDGDGYGVSVLGLEKQGRVYNTGHMRGQLRRWGLDEETVERITSQYWKALHSIDSRFRMDGIGHLSPNQFVPFTEIREKLPEIKQIIGQTVAEIRSAYEQSR
uniref:Uncharacterized protein n=1 Tax=Desulfacinum infernum TaxID=35837 RepID=A0A832A467_9BACT